jgi:NADP-dependent 3-hydroxy acid dehydrogenase YdfG
MPFRNGRVAVVIGATGAIGKAIAGRLVADGFTVCATGSTQERVDDLVRATGWPRDQIEGYPIDLRREADVRHFCDTRLERHARIDVLVHCAGVIHLGDLEHARIEDLDDQYLVNVRAPVQITQLLLPRLKMCQGQVAFINSTAGVRASSGAGQYGSTKHALRAVADSLREEVNPMGVRVLSVFLGRTASRMQAEVHQREGRPYDESKLLQPDDVASVVIHALGMPRTAEVTDVWIRPLLKSY